MQLYVYYETLGEARDYSTAKIRTWLTFVHT